MKILVISDDPLTHSGFGTVVNNLFSNLIQKKKDIEVRGIACFPDNSMEKRPYTIYKTTGLAPDRHGAQTFLQVKQKWNPDIIFLLGDWWYWNITFFNKNWKANHNVTSKIWYYVPLDGITLSEEAKRVYREADKLFSMTPFGTEFLEDVTNKKITYLPHGYNSSNFNHKDREEKTQKDTFTFGAVSRNTRRKNVWAITEAFNLFMLDPMVIQLKDMKFNLLLHVPKNDEMGGNLEQYIKFRNFKNISFTEDVNISEGTVKGIKAEEMQDKVYSKIDCVISAGREGFGLPYLEARVCGCKLILPTYSGHASMGYNETEYYTITSFSPEARTDTIDLNVNPIEIKKAMLNVLSESLCKSTQSLDDEKELAWENLPTNTLIEAINNEQSKKTNTIVVYRKSGGLGDILCLTPSLSSLHDKYPNHKIKLVLEKKYWLAMTLNFVELTEETPEDSDLFINIQGENDPCTQFEQEDLSNYGKFTRDRMEAFASALNVSIHNYSKPIINPEYKESSYLNTKPNIIIQAKAAEDYKSYESTSKLIKEIYNKYKTEYTILVEIQGQFHNCNEDGTIEKNPKEIIDVNQFYRVIEFAHKVIGFDSFLMHVCAAFETKFIGIFGPTHPQARISKASKSVAVHANLDCIGCGRWAKSKCKITNSLNSACMTEEYLSLNNIMEQINGNL